MADKEIKYSGAWKVCEDCGCVLYLEYPHPICPACADKREANKALDKAVVSMGKTAAMVKENSITPESVETAMADYAESLKAEGKGK